tara:strand:+ start:3447 stop:4700 length:1254 start_codon:yes stop_codon:yes gene_type:complete
MICSFLILINIAIPAYALNDAKQIVLEAWTLVNEGFYSPEKFNEINFRKIRQITLQKDIETSEEAYSAIEDMLKPLEDPYTRILRPKDYELLKSTNLGSEINGVGLQLGTDDESGEIIVISTLSGSPAEDSGIIIGSILNKVNGVLCKELGLATTATRLRGETSSKVIVEITAPNGDTREIELERRSVDLQPIRTKRLRDESHTIGYIRITQFSESVPKKIEEAIKDLQEKDIEGLILDLRNNSGGLVSSGIAVADYFLSNGTIVETKNRDGIIQEINANESELFKGPMVTLVNKGTASASEILAAALKDNKRSQLIGETTFGKGLIQSLKNLSDSSGLAITIASYLTPTGKAIQGEGILPDKTLDIPQPISPASEDDKWLKDAQIVLISKIDEYLTENTDLGNQSSENLLDDEMNP